jgi:hypothetical protein
VLTDRLAAMLNDHEPGWRLPRRSDLARRHSVTMAEIDTAITELAARNLVRAMADGQVYRASPAEYLITLDQLPYLGTCIDPMGSALTCASRNVMRRTVPEGITHELRLQPGIQACAVQTTWNMDGSPAALSTTYLPAHLAAILVPPQDSGAGPAAALNPVPAPAAAGTPVARPGAMYLEVQPPPRWAAGLLRLRQSEPAITITVRLDDPAIGAPVALTVAMLHPARFRIAVETPPAQPRSRPGTRSADRNSQPGTGIQGAHDDPAGYLTGTAG